MKNSVEEQFAILYRIAKQKDELYRNIAGQLDISDTEFSVLHYFCYSKKYFTQSELSEQLSIPEQTINSTITSLVKRGYVYLEDTTAAHNSKMIRLTEAGAVLCQNKIVPVLSKEIKAFSRLTEEERNNLISLSQIHHLFLLKEFNGFLESIRSDAK